MGRGAVAAAVALLCLWGLHVAGVSGMRRFWRGDGVGRAPWQDVSDTAAHEQRLPLRPMPHRSSDEPLSQTPDHAHDVGKSAIPADPAATRMIRIRGRVLVVERPADSPREGSPTALDPLTLGIERDELLKSLVVRIAETGASATVSEAGSFLLETALPTQTRALTLHCDSNLLLPENRNPEVHIELAEQLNPTDIDIELHMIPAVTMRPMYHGRPLRPRDLENPAVRDEFVRQTADVVNRVMRPPNDLTSGHEISPNASFAGEGWSSRMTQPSSSESVTRP
jgi:hypothetical protein